MAGQIMEMSTAVVRQSPSMRKRLQLRVKSLNFSHLKGLGVIFIHLIPLRALRQWPLQPLPPHPFLPDLCPQQPLVLVDQHSSVSLPLPLPSMFPQHFPIIPTHHTNCLHRNNTFEQLNFVCRCEKRIRCNQSINQSMFVFYSLKPGP